MKARVINVEESVIYNREIYKFEDEFEVDEAIGKSLCERGYIEIVTDNPDLFKQDDVVEIKDEKDLDSMTYQELKAYASELGLSANGKKDELTERIREFLCEIERPEVYVEELPDTSMPE